MRLKDIMSVGIVTISPRETATAARAEGLMRTIAMTSLVSSV
jgi:hypothetical protein